MKQSTVRFAVVPFDLFDKRHSHLTARNRAVLAARMFSRTIAPRLDKLQGKLAMMEVAITEAWAKLEKGELTELQCAHRVNAIIDRKRDTTRDLSSLIRNACRAHYERARKVGVFHCKIGKGLRRDGKTLALFNEAYGNLIKRTETVAETVTEITENKARKLQRKVENLRNNLARFHDTRIDTYVDGKQVEAKKDATRAEADVYLSVAEARFIIESYEKDRHILPAWGEKRRAVTREEYRNAQYVVNMYGETADGLTIPQREVEQAKERTETTLDLLRDALRKEIEKGNEPRTETKTIERERIKPVLGVIHNLVKRMDIGTENARSLVLDASTKRFAEHERRYVMSWTAGEVFSIVSLKLWEYVSEFGIIPEEKVVVSWVLSTFRNFWRNAKQDRKRFVRYSQGNVDISVDAAGIATTTLPDVSSVWDASELVKQYERLND